MRVSFYSSGIIFEKILMNWDYFYESFENDNYVTLQFRNNTIIYVTSGGSVYNISEDKVEFDGARNSILSGCGICLITNTDTGAKLIAGNESQTWEEELFLIDYESKYQDELKWFQHYGERDFDNRQVGNIKIINNAVSRKFVNIPFNSGEIIRGYES